MKAMLSVMMLVFAVTQPVTAEPAATTNYLQSDRAACIVSAGGDKAKLTDCMALINGDSACDSEKARAEKYYDKVTDICEKAGMDIPACLRKAKDYADECADHKLEKSRAKAKKAKQDKEEASYIDALLGGRKASDESLEETVDELSERCQNLGLEAYLKRQSELEKSAQEARDALRKIQTDAAKEQTTAAKDISKLKNDVEKVASEHRRESDRQAQDAAEASQKFHLSMNELEVKKAESRAAKFPKQMQLSQSYSEELAKLLPYSDIEGQCKELAREMRRQKALNSTLSSNFIAAAYDNKASILTFYNQCIETKIQEKKAIRAQYRLQRQALKGDLESYDDQVRRLEQARQTETKNFASIQQRFTESQAKAVEEVTRRQMAVQTEIQQTNQALEKQAQETEEALKEARKRVERAVEKIEDLGPQPKGESPLQSLANFNNFLKSVNNLLHKPGCEKVGSAFVESSEVLAWKDNSKKAAKANYYSSEDSKSSRTAAAVGKARGEKGSETD